MWPCCSFVMISPSISVAAVYPSSLTPSSASVAPPRINKTCPETYSVLLQQCIAHIRTSMCSVIAALNTTLFLSLVTGADGPFPVKLSEHFAGAISSASIPLSLSLPSKTYIAFPAIISEIPNLDTLDGPTPRGAGDTISPLGSPAEPIARGGAAKMHITSSDASGPGGTFPVATPVKSAKKSATKSSAVATAAVAAALARPSEYYFVHLFVAAIASGVLDPSTPNLARMQKIIDFVPKEQNTSVRCIVPSIQGIMGSAVGPKILDVPIKMRVFTANSEDARLLTECAARHSALPLQQQPFVLLAPSLQLAAMYDPNYLDLSEPAIADRLRKQAKTRAVKLVRDCVYESAGICTPEMLSGYYGFEAPALALAPFFQRRYKCAQDENGQPMACIPFAARNKMPFDTPSNLRSDLSGGAREEDEEDEDVDDGMDGISEIPAAGSGLITWASRGIQKSSHSSSTSSLRSTAPLDSNTQESTLIPSAPPAASSDVVGQQKAPNLESEAHAALRMKAASAVSPQRLFK